MAAVATIKLEGFAELERRLKKLGPKIARRELGKAVRAAAKPVIKTARARVPIATGELRKSLGTKSKTYKHAGGGTAVHVLRRRTASRSLWLRTRAMVESGPRR